MGLSYNTDDIAGDDTNWDRNDLCVMLCRDR